MVGGVGSKHDDVHLCICDVCLHDVLSLFTRSSRQVLAKGNKMVDILTAIKDFKKGIYDLEWQHKK